jgi:hypothetical protein
MYQCKQYNELSLSFNPAHCFYSEYDSVIDLFHEAVVDASSGGGLVWGHL